MKNIGVTLLLSILLTGCSGVPRSWGPGEAYYFYPKGEYETVEKIIIQNGRGYSDSTYFPVTIHNLVQKHLKLQDKKALPEARLALSTLKKQWGTETWLPLYEEMIDYLEKNGDKVSFHSSQTATCNRLMNNLTLIDQADRLIDVADYEAAYWYSLIVNSECSTSSSKVILVTNLIEIDLEKGKSMYRRVVAEIGNDTSSRAEFDRLVCEARDRNSRYDLSNLFMLEKQGLFACNEEWDYSRHVE
jgi:hypothetical protein